MKVNIATKSDNAFIFTIKKMTFHWLNVKRLIALALLVTNIYVKKTSKPTPEELNKLLNVELQGLLKCSNKNHL